MPSIPAIRYPSYDDLGHSAAQRLSRSVDCNEARTQDSRLVHFLKFINHYGLRDEYLTADVNVIDRIRTRYVTFLLSGYTLPGREIKVGTIQGYMKAINPHYRERGLPDFYDWRLDCDANSLLKEQKSYESLPDRRAPLPHKMLAKMHELSKEDRLGFRACIWDFVNLGRYGGFRMQEFAMDKSNEIKYYVKPNGELVTRAFVLRNFIFRTVDSIRLRNPMGSRHAIHDSGNEFDVQKNRQNGQIIFYKRVLAHPEYCPVEAQISIYARAVELGQGDEDPLCIYRDPRGTHYLTGDAITQYFRFLMVLVFPNISDEELKLISTHSIRVTACVELSEAGKSGWYIKLRLRWLSDCYTVYLRNTSNICEQHIEALSGAHERMAALAVSLVGVPEANDTPGTADSVEYDLEDDD